VHPSARSLRATVDRLDDVLTGSLFMVSVTVFCTGAAMCDQAAAQALRLIGDQSFIGPEFVKLGFEELGPIIVALSVAARVGAGFAAEVATLTSEETLDAKELYGAAPAQTLLAPMGMALIIGTTALGLLSTVTWEVAGMATSLLRYGVSPLTFFHPEAITLRCLVLCVAKNASFGAGIFVAALTSGLASKRGAQAVGDATTRAVVLSILAVMLANLLVDVAAFTSWPEAA
jgi:phospholipid/cholesterol/gamma-HCH transport system permease protein